MRYANMVLFLSLVLSLVAYGSGSSPANMGRLLRWRWGRLLFRLPLLTLAARILSFRIGASIRGYRGMQ